MWITEEKMRNEIFLDYEDMVEDHCELAMKCWGCVLLFLHWWKQKKGVKQIANFPIMRIQMCML